MDTGSSCNSPGTEVGLLCQVTDANGGVTKYTYDGGNRLLTIVDPRGYTELSNTYDPADGRVVAQSLADSTSTYQMAYTVNGSGQITQTTITDPNGNVEQKSFDSNGFVIGDIRAVGSSVQQTYSYTRNSTTELLTVVITYLTHPIDAVKIGPNGTIPTIILACRFWD